MPQGAITGRVNKMLRTVLPIIIDLASFLILNLRLFTDRYTLPDGEERIRQYNAIEKIENGDNTAVLYLQIFFLLISISSTILLALGFKNRIIRLIQLLSTAAVVLLAIIMMIIAANTHLKY